MNSVPAPPRARNVAKGSNSILSSRSGLSIDHWPARCPWRRPVAVFSVGVSASTRGSRTPLGFAGRRRATLRSETCVRVAAARGRVLVRSWAADASSAVAGVRDASLEPPYKCLQGGACSRISLGASGAPRHASMQRRIV